MIGLLQRVSYAQVTVSDETISKIDHGLLVFVGIEKHDTESSAKKLIDKLLKYRVFEDSSGKMNLSLTDISGDLLLVSQFTLVANTNSGNRPSFSCAAPPALGREIFDFACGYAQKTHPANVQTGEFGTDMKVSLLNDGPVTFWLQS